MPGSQTDIKKIDERDAFGKWTQNVCGGVVYVEDEMKRFCDIDYYKLSEF